MTDMANPETTTPSVEGDRLEAIAGVIDPEASAFIDARQSCSDEVWNEVSARYETALTKARQIAALPCKGGATNDHLHFAVSTFLARYKGNNGLEAMREATAPMFAALPCKGERPSRGFA